MDGETKSAVRLSLGLFEAGDWQEALQTARRGCDIAPAHDHAAAGAQSARSRERAAATGALSHVLITHQEAWSLADMMGVPLFQVMVLIERCADRAYANDWEAAAADAHAISDRRLPDHIAFPGFAP